MIKFLLVLFSIQFVSANEFDLPAGSKLKERALAPRTNECQLCHMKRSQKIMMLDKVNKTDREHFEIDIQHGTLKKACHDCHDINNSDRLMAPATFENTSILCQRCHQERYREWQYGRHGKISNSWKENIIVYHCIDCHNPHDVRYKQMEAHPGHKHRGAAH